MCTKSGHFFLWLKFEVEDIPLILEQILLDINNDWYDN